MKKNHLKHLKPITNNSSLKLVLPLFLLLAGCPLIPPYKTPELAVPNLYPQDSRKLAETADQHSPADISWQEYFDDHELKKLISIALVNNADLRTAVLRISEAKALSGYQASERYPTVNLQASLERSRIPASLNFTRKTLLLNQYQANVAIVSWELDLWGRISSLNEAALNNYLATEAIRHAVTIVMVAQVADSYLELCDLDERISIARETLTSRTETLRIFRLRNRVGSTSLLNLTQVETLHTQAQSLLVQLEQRRAEKEHELIQILGTSASLEMHTQPVSERLIKGNLKVGTPSDLLISRPDIMAAEYKLKAANANIGAARAAFFPQISLIGRTGSASTEFSQLFNADTRAWSFMPSVSLPIFNGGRNRSGLDLATVRKNIAVIDYETTIQKAFREVSDALTAKDAINQQLEIAREELRIQTDRARLSKLRFDHGASAFLEVLDAERDLLQAKQNLVQVNTAYLTSKVYLYSALGGGTF